MQDLANFVFRSLQYLRVLIAIAICLSLVVFFYWYFKIKRGTLKSVFFWLITLLHLFVTINFFLAGTGIHPINSFNLKHPISVELEMLSSNEGPIVPNPGLRFRLLVWTYLLAAGVLFLFHTWLGLKMLLKERKHGLKRLLGFIPLIAPLLTLVYYPLYLKVMSDFFQSAHAAIMRHADILILLVAPIVIAVLWVFIGFFIGKVKEMKSYEKRAVAQAPAADSARMSDSHPAKRDKRAVDIKAKEPSRCLSLSLAVQTSDMTTLKAQGTNFSRALLEAELSLRDKVFFRDILIVVTGMEPDGPVVITSETKVNIKKTEDQVILNCPSCGTIQEEIRQTCSSCSTELPVKIL